MVHNNQNNFTGLDFFNLKIFAPKFLERQQSKSLAPAGFESVNNKFAVGKEIIKNYT